MPCLISDKSDGKDNVRGTTDYFTSVALCYCVKEHAEQAKPEATPNKIKGTRCCFCVPRVVAFYFEKHPGSVYAVVIAESIQLNQFV